MRNAPLFGVLLLGALMPACRPSSDSGSNTPPTPAPPPAAARPPGAPSGTPLGRGIIEGQVRLTGTPPPPALMDTSPSVLSACGDKVPDRSLTVGEQGGLAHVVISLANGAALPAEGVTAPPAVLDQKRCAYEPPALAARAGGTLEVRNSDPVMHNVRAVAGTQPVFNVAMPLEGMSLRKVLPATPGTVQVKCDVHPWMRAVVRTFEHPYFTSTDAQGRYRLEVPEGHHTLVLWHGRLPESSRPITVKAGQTLHLEHVWETGELR